MSRNCNCATTCVAKHLLLYFEMHWKQINVTKFGKKLKICFTQNNFLHSLTDRDVVMQFLVGKMLRGLLSLMWVIFCVYLYGLSIDTHLCFIISIYFLQQPFVLESMRYNKWMFKCCRFKIFFWNINKCIECLNYFGIPTYIDI